MTVITLLQALTEPHRSQAINNTPADHYLKQVDKIYQAVHDAFNWNESPEGFEYWYKKYKALKKLGV